MIGRITIVHCNYETLFGKFVSSFCIFTTNRGLYFGTTIGAIFHIVIQSRRINFKSFTNLIENSMMTNICININVVSSNNSATNNAACIAQWFLFIRHNTSPSMVFAVVACCYNAISYVFHPFSQMFFFCMFFIHISCAFSFDCIEQSIVF